MKNLIQKKKASGFTIIEVMIVLAIAGLIMVIVFIAVPQLQRNQRDNSRQSIANRLKAEMETYAGNNQGQYPFSTASACGGTDTGKWCDFYVRYISGGKVKVTDPSTGNDVVSASPATAPTANGFAVYSFSNYQATGLPAVAGAFAVVYGAACSGETLAGSGGTGLTTRHYAVLIGLDRTNTRYCVDNG
jgi:prepilin-type N-terminal cleavage/methylation domain-containing protein